ncbi:MAG TPA: DUF3048 domain-containing protein [Patescibacteria group bacterium]|nr:DUF3048 domain-containing protein [Patescibacteria group bacterium]
MKTKWGMIGFFVVLFVIAVGLSWVLFSFVFKANTPGVNSANVNDARSKIASLPKTEPCPINGELYTSEEKSIWNGRRPAFVMVENHVDSRPPNGLSKADWVYEAVAEGGITRFGAVFYCGTAAGDVTVAPVRSSRVYFINSASEYGDRPLYVHVGGANDYGANGGPKPNGEIDPRVDALGLLTQIGWRIPGGNDYDASYDAGYPIFFRNLERLGHPIAIEHTMEISTDALYQDAEKRGLAYTAKDGTPWTKGFVPYNFVDDNKASSPTATDIKFDFWSSQPDYSVEWKYDAKNNDYLRWDGGQPHTDGDYNNVQLSAKNIIVMQVQETGPVDSEEHMIEQNIGTGKALLFQNGTVTNITWTKNDRTSRTKFTDGNGKEISFVRGVTWVEEIPSGNSVNYN